MIISFSGLDGSGKTTQVRELEQYFLKKGLKVKVFPIMKYSISNIISKKTTKKTIKNFEKIYAAKKGCKFFIIAQLKKILACFDILVFILFIYPFYRTKKRVVLCDRYFYDQLIHWEYMGLIGDIFLRTYLLFTPRPDFAFYLEGKISDIKKRKDEHPLEYYTFKKYIYKKFRKYFIIISPGTISDVSKGIIDTIKRI